MHPLPCSPQARNPLPAAVATPCSLAARRLANRCPVTHYHATRCPASHDVVMQPVSLHPAALQPTTHYHATRRCTPMPSPPLPCNPHRHVVLPVSMQPDAMHTVAMLPTAMHPTTIHLTAIHLTAMNSFATYPRNGPVQPFATHPRYFFRPKSV